MTGWEALIENLLNDKRLGMSVEKKRRHIKKKKHREHPTLVNLFQDKLPQNLSKWMKSKVTMPFYNAVFIYKNSQIYTNMFANAIIYSKLDIFYVILVSTQESIDDVVSDPDAQISSRQKYKERKKPETISLELPRKGLAKVLTPCAGRMQLSTNKSFAYAAEMIKAGEGKLSDFAISRSTFLCPEERNRE